MEQRGSAFPVRTVCRRIRIGPVKLQRSPRPLSRRALSHRSVGKTHSLHFAGIMPFCPTGASTNYALSLLGLLNPNQPARATEFEQRFPHWVRTTRSNGSHRICIAQGYHHQMTRTCSAHLHSGLQEHQLAGSVFPVTRFRLDSRFPANRVILLYSNHVSLCIAPKYAKA